jgi:hypothetical protein
MKIKKSMLIFFLICGAVTVLPVGCSTDAGRRKLPKDIPDAVKKAVKKAPKDTLIGIGRATGENPNLARTIAAARARTSITRQLGAMTKEMIHIYRNEGGIDAETVVSFEEGFNVTLSVSTLSGAVVIYEEQDAQGACWAAVMLRKNEAFNEIVRAQNAVKAASAAPASADSAAVSFDITGKINSTFDKAAGLDIKVN